MALDMLWILLQMERSAFCPGGSSRAVRPALLYMQTVLARCLMNVVSIQPLRDSSQLISVLAGTAAGGFPSPAADYYEPPISLDELLNIRAPHVWIVRVQGESMRDAGIYDGGVLIVDRSITATKGQIVLAYVDNQPLVKRLAKDNADRWLLESAHPDYKTITPDQYGSIDVFGVVTWDLTKHVC